MRQLAFYPGCALHSMSWGYRESIKHVMEALELELTELEDWSCCGASAAHSLDERMSVLLPARNLVSAQELGRDLAIACPMCFKRLSYARHVLQEQKIDHPWAINPDLAIMDLARMLASDEMLGKIKERVVLPLSGLRVVCYYGCQVVRHPKFTGYTDYENPQHLDAMARTLGATPIDWSFKAVCCGAGLGVPKRHIGLFLINKLVTQARASGAQAIIVCCPLCQSNLDLYQRQLYGEEAGNAEEALPIIYYTELLSLAFGQDSVHPALKSHMVNPLPLVNRIISAS